MCSVLSDAVVEKPDFRIKKRGKPACSVPEKKKVHRVKIKYRCIVVNEKSQGKIQRFKHAGRLSCVIVQDFRFLY